MELTDSLVSQCVIPGKFDYKPFIHQT